jgi:hypothetical protein
VSPNVAWNGSLESYHPYLPPQKVSKISKIECIHSRLPKNSKRHFGRLGPLGVKWILEPKDLLSDNRSGSPNIHGLRNPGFYSKWCLARCNTMDPFNNNLANFCQDLTSVQTWQTEQRKLDIKYGQKSPLRVELSHVWPCHRPFY